jgi:hypothetical protein
MVILSRLFSWEKLPPQVAQIIAAITQARHNAGAPWGIYLSPTSELHLSFLWVGRVKTRVGLRCSAVVSALLLTVCCGMSVAQADIVVYGNGQKAAFLASLTDGDVEWGFPSSSPPVNGVAIFNAPAIGSVIRATAISNGVAQAVALQDALNTETKDWLTTVTGGATMVFEFQNNPVSGVGGLFFRRSVFNTPLSNGGSIQATVTFADSTSQNFTFSSGNPESTDFWGITSSDVKISMISFSSSTPSTDFMTSDFLVAGQFSAAVPLPPSLALAMLSCAGAGIGAWRRRRQAEAGQAP